MITNILVLLAGLALVVFGADILVDGASSIARKAHISEFVIGLTIVGFGTSCPELVVSLTGAIQGNSDISVGNVLGSNIFNTLFILGVTAIIAPVVISGDNRKRDIPITFAITAFFAATLLFGQGISRLEGIVYVILFAGYLFYSFKMDAVTLEEESEAKTFSLAVSIGLVLAGLAGLVFGGKFFVGAAEQIARMAGVSDKFIAVTILAGGTSMPELVTCIVAAAKKKDQLALGNILGSNVFNILLIIGLSAIVNPISSQGVTPVDITVLMVSAAILLLACFTGRKNVIDRWEGALFTCIFAGYMAYLTVMA